MVVNYNARDHLVACITSLKAAGVSRIVVADNASDDGSAEAVARLHPDVSFHPTGANLGYGAAANVGARGLVEDYLLVCNPDTLFDTDTVGRMVAALEDEPSAGVAGPRIDTSAGDIYPSARTFPTVIDSIGHGFLGIFWRLNPWSRRYLMADRPLDRPSRVDWVSGSCMLFRKTAFDEIGGFDESFFMYAEDVDICRRLAEAGWVRIYEPAARVTHVQGVSSSRHPYRMIVAHHRSLLRFAALTAKDRRDRALLPLVALGLGLRAGILALGRAGERFRGN